jgi:hypothetical protein
MSTAARRYLRSIVRDTDPFDLAFAGLVALLVVLVGLTFREYAVSNDEGLQQQYGELIVAYYKSGFTDRSVFNFGNLYLYGGLFDIVAVFFTHLLPFNIYDIRHLLSALAGVGGVVAVWGTARMIAGPRAGFFAALALATCGVWYGGMFNHTKDVPFAAAVMGATFFLLRATHDLPKPRWRDILWFGLLLGCALGLRVIGLLMIGFVGVAIILQTWADRTDWRRFLRAGMQSAVRFFPAFVLAYVIMIASWPWASLDLLNPLRAVFAFAHFHYPIRTILAGQVYLMNEVPRWYEPEYIAIKLPLVMLASACIAVIAAAWAMVTRAGTPLDRRSRQDMAILLFAVVFPLACQILGNGPSFTGMRHYLFVVPPIAVLAGIGIHLGLSFLDRQGRWAAAGAVAVVAAAFVADVATLVRLHPYEYLFFNSLVGGLEGASRRYETDYWVNVMPAAVKELEHFIDSTDISTDPTHRTPYLVAVCGERVSFENEADPRLKFTADWNQADFYIAPTHMDCDRVLRGRVVGVIERVGVPIGVVKDLRGISAQARWAPVAVAYGTADRPFARTPRRGG